MCFKRRDTYPVKRMHLATDSPPKVYPFISRVLFIFHFFFSHNNPKPTQVPPRKVSNLNFSERLLLCQSKLETSWWNRLPWTISQVAPTSYWPKRLVLRVRSSCLLKSRLSQELEDPGNRWLFVIQMVSRNHLSRYWRLLVWGRSRLAVFVGC